MIAYVQLRASDSFDEDALFCDMAQYYGVFDLRRHTIPAQAALVMGLPGDSRIMRALSGRKASTEVILLAGILDHLRMMAWSRSKAAKNKQSRPDPIMPLLIEQSKKEDDIVSFESGEEFERYRESLLKGEKNG